MDSNMIEKIFPSATERKFFSVYRKIFSIEEIEKNTVLQWCFGATLLAFFVTFFSWNESSAISISSVRDNTFVCWQYFQTCGDWYFLQSLPDGYSQSIFYMGVFVLMVLVVYLMSVKEWVLAHVIMVMLWCWKFLGVFVLTRAFAGNFDYYDVVLGAVLLFLPHKLFFLRTAFVTLYFLAATIKIHDGWILGTYFTSLKAGLPIFPDILTPLITNLVIFMQIVGAWFLFSSNKKIQIVVLVYFVLFHLYSGALVNFRYPTTALLALLILFTSMHREKMETPLDKKSIVGWLMILLLFAIQSIAFLIPGDQKLTLEGNMYGLYMFEANHQCVAEYGFVNNAGSSTMITKTYANARNRCDPYVEWFHVTQYCRNKDIAKISWKFDHSINGEEFQRIVDLDDVCVTTYKPFQHNSWIKTEKDNPEKMGYPAKNFYR